MMLRNYCGDAPAENLPFLLKRKVFWVPSWISHFRSVSGVGKFAGLRKTLRSSSLVRTTFVLESTFISKTGTNVYGALWAEAAMFFSIWRRNAGVDFGGLSDFNSPWYLLTTHKLSASY